MCAGRTGVDLMRLAPVSVRGGNSFTPAWTRISFANPHNSIERINAAPVSSAEASNVCVSALSECCAERSSSRRARRSIAAKRDNAKEAPARRQPSTTERWALRSKAPVHNLLICRPMEKRPSQRYGIQTVKVVTEAAARHAREVEVQSTLTTSMGPSAPPLPSSVPLTRYPLPSLVAAGASCNVYNRQK